MFAYGAALPPWSQGEPDYDQRPSGLGNPAAFKVTQRVRTRPGNAHPYWEAQAAGALC